MDGRQCYVLTLNATVKDVQYETRRMWVDEERFVALRQEMYAKSGKLLKVSRVLDVQKIGDRWFPVKEEISDQLKQGSRTQFIMAEVRLDVPVSESFSAFGTWADEERPVTVASPARSWPCVPVAFRPALCAFGLSRGFRACSDRRAGSQRTTPPWRCLRASDGL